MANLSKVLEPITFRYVRDIDSLDDSQLESHGYCRGYPCAHRHTIRDAQHHWCYHCVIKIQSNVCGFNLNFLHSYYNYKYENLWKQIHIGEPDECWDMNLPGGKTPRRMCFPSYRSFYTGRASENVTPQKLIYQCAWGDVGSLVISKACGNPWCGNPLHLISSWNIGLPPKNIQPFVTEFRPEQLMLITNASHIGKESEVIRNAHRHTIRHPLCAKDPPDYDEG